MGIGEFARLSRLSPHALRRYDEMGLLRPRRVDQASGYRWYGSEQLEQARLVAELRQIGMPLAQIKAVLPTPAPVAAIQVARWWSAAETDHAARRDLASFLIDRLNGKRSVMYDVSVRSVPARSVLSLLRHLRAEEFAPAAQDFFGRFGDVPRLDGIDGASFVVYHGEVSEDSDGPVEWCRPVPADHAAELAARFPDLVLRSEAAHEEAFVRLARNPARTPAAQSLLVLETLFTWALEQHRRPSGSVRQVFSSPRTASGLECDFAVPIAPHQPDTSVSSGLAPADGADLYFESRGEGPPLLLITGGGGDCAFYSPIADILASSYTVLSYDRRGNSRSRLHGAPVPITLAEQSADAVAVLRACGFSSAAVFGNSGGATVALDLAARYPSAASVVIAHEPPLPRVLPDPTPVFAVYDEISQVLSRDGWRAAFALLQDQISHLPPDDLPLLLDPATVLPEGPGLDLMMRLNRNWEYLLRYEMRSFIDYVPAAEPVKAGGVRVVLAAGADTQDPHSRDICLALADQLGAEFAEVPGGHNAPMEAPAAFAARLRELL